MATDRLTCSSRSRVQDNPPARMSRMFSNTRYVSILAMLSVRERAKRADRLLSLHSLRTINPPTSCMSRKSRFAGTINAGTPSLERDPPRGYVLSASSIYTSSDISAKILRDLSTIDHKLTKPSISQIVLEHIIKYLYRNSTNICSCAKCRTHC